MNHFDRDATVFNRGATDHRAVLIITDADVDEIPVAELSALNARNIVPYIIYINTENVRATEEDAAGPSLIDSIRNMAVIILSLDRRWLQRAYARSTNVKRFVLN
ncbi:MAG: hypothetical protein Ct9H300mP25_05800 [Acidobacteriota bacterium]|nr:MAG: hypothetical protein Ct9H300mP25_05800 [Acidobacteriota bacterium]